MTTAGKAFRVADDTQNFRRSRDEKQVTVENGRRQAQQRPGMLMLSNHGEGAAAGFRVEISRWKIPIENHTQPSLPFS